MPPNPQGGKHTIPTIKLGEEYITDSKKIATALESRYPEPSLHLDASELKEVEDALMPAFHPLIPNFIPRVPRNILNPSSAEYFNKTRTERFGMPLDELEKKQGGPQAYEAAKEPWGKMLEIVKRNSDGPFVLGKEGLSTLLHINTKARCVINANAAAVSYADFVIVSAIEFGKRTGEDNFKAIMNFDPAFKELYEACKPWLARDDH